MGWRIYSISLYQVHFELGWGAYGLHDLLPYKTKNDSGNAYDDSGNTQDDSGNA